MTNISHICGRPPPDIFYTSDGRPVAAITLVLYLVDEAPGLLGQVQIIQDDYDHLTIRMTPNPLPTESVKIYQRNKVKELLGQDMHVSFEIVDCIPRESSGKYHFTKCILNA